MHDYTCPLRLPAGSSVFCYCSELHSLPVPRIQPPENVFFTSSPRRGSCHLKSTRKRDILCPEAQLLEPLKTCVFVCQHKLPLISRRGNFHFKSALTSGWHIYIYIIYIHFYLFVCVHSKTHMLTSTSLAVFFMTLRKTAVITGSSNGHLATLLTFLSETISKEDRAHLQ